MLYIFAKFPKEFKMQFYQKIAPKFYAVPYALCRAGCREILQGVRLHVRKRNRWRKSRPAVEICRISTAGKHYVVCCYKI